jgi:hypothetical protein
LIHHAPVPLDSVLQVENVATALAQEAVPPDMARMKKAA